MPPHPPSLSSSTSRAWHTLAAACVVVVLCALSYASDDGSARVVVSVLAKPPPVAVLASPISCASTVVAIDPSSVTSPSPSRFDVVIGGYEFLTRDDVAKHHAWDLNLPLATIVFYRRTRAEVKARAWRCASGMTAIERLMFPNYGRDASAFWDWTMFRYDIPPRAVAYLHGHGALAWHTSCETVFTRIKTYYDDMLRVHGDDDGGAYSRRIGGNNVTDVDAADDVGYAPESMVTLSFARGRRETPFAPLEWNGGRRRLLTARTNSDDSYDAVETAKCVDVLRSVNVTLKPATVRSCCGTFIMPGRFIRGYALEVYKALYDSIMDQSMDDGISGRACFEFIVYGMFSANNLPAHVKAPDVNLTALSTWFDRAHARTRELKPAMKSCERNYKSSMFPFLPYLGDAHRRVFFNKIWFPARRYVQGDVPP